MIADAACPCGRTDARQHPVSLSTCCGRWLGHFEVAPAPDAETLMRSRYTAFVLGDETYLLATWHPDTRPSEARPEPGMRWLGLELREHRVIDVDTAEVEFAARYRLAGRAVRLHERSRFVREHGRWYYLRGEAP